MCVILNLDVIIILYFSFLRVTADTSWLLEPQHQRYSLDQGVAQMGGHTCCVFSTVFVDDTSLCALLCLGGGGAV